MDKLLKKHICELAKFLTQIVSFSCYCGIRYMCPYNLTDRSPLPTAWHYTELIRECVYKAKP
jgi:hypothetical protein